jgi:hypothetical protein
MKTGRRLSRACGIGYVSIQICSPPRALPTAQDAFKEFFKENKGLKLRIDVKSMRFVTPDVAIEDGTSSVIPPDGSPPSQGSYTNVHVNKGGQWVCRACMKPLTLPPGNYEHLHGLDWAVGEWVDEGDAPEIDHVTLDWTDARAWGGGSWSHSGSGSYGGGYHYAGYGGGGGYYGGGFHPGGFLAAYASGVYNSQQY